MILPFIIITAIIFLFLTKKKKDEYIVKPSSYKDYTDIDPFPHVKKIPSEEVLNRLETVKLYDDFKEFFTFSFNHIGNMDSYYLPMYYDQEFDIVSMDHIGIAFTLEDNDIFLEFYGFSGEINLNKGDRITFLFEDEKRLEIVLSTKGASGRMSLGVRKSNNSEPISIEQLTVFSSYKLLKWKYTGVNKIEIVGDNTLFCIACDIHNKETSQELIIKMATIIKNVYDERYASVEDVAGL